MQKLLSSDRKHSSGLRLKGIRKFSTHSESLRMFYEKRNRPGDLLASSRRYQHPVSQGWDSAPSGVHVSPELQVRLLRKVAAHRGHVQALSVTLPQKVNPNSLSAHAETEKLSEPCNGMKLTQ